MKGKRMFFAGAVVGAALMVSVSAAADSLSLIGKKVTSETEVYLDGKLFDTAPVINGTSLAPLRKAYEAAGYTVSYKEKKVYLESKKGEGGNLSTDNTVSEPTSSSTSKDDLKKEIEEKLSKIKVNIHINKVTADPANGLSADEQEAAKEKIKELEAELAKLEKQLTELKS